MGSSPSLAGCSLDFYTVPRLLTKHAASRPLRKYHDAASVSGSLSRREQRPQAMTSSGRPNAARLEWAATPGYRLCLLKISITLFRKLKLHIATVKGAANTQRSCSPTPDHVHRVKELLPKFNDMNWLFQFPKLWSFCASMHTTLQDGFPEDDPVTSMRLNAHQSYPYRADKPLSHTDAVLAPKGKRQYASVTFTRSMTLKSILSRENNAKWLILPRYLLSYEGVLADHSFLFAAKACF